MPFITQTLWAEDFVVFKVILASVLLSYTLSLFLSSCLGPLYTWVVSFYYGYTDLAAGARGVFQRETLESLLSVQLGGCKSHLPWLLKSSACCIKKIVSCKPPPDPTTSSPLCLGGDRGEDKSVEGERRKNKFNGRNIYKKNVCMCVFVCVSRWE